MASSDSATFEQADDIFIVCWPNSTHLNRCTVVADEVSHSDVLGAPIGVLTRLRRLAEPLSFSRTRESSVLNWPPHHWTTHFYLIVTISTRKP